MAPLTTLLEVVDLSVKFPSRGGAVEAVSGVSFTLARGRVVCLLGESGSGKSVTLRSIVRLNHGARTTGRIVLDGQNVLAMSRREIRDSRRGAAAMVFQEPMTALDPVYTIGAQIEETVRRHRNVNRIDARRRALELLELVQIASPARCLAAYPHELSGGMRQRVMIAIAPACDPALLLADEPTSALDVTVQAQILWLLRDLQRRLGLGLIVVADDALVMYAGRIVEQTTVERLFSQLVHPYTRGLMAATVRRGQRGRALVLDPRLVVLDEPVSALDKSVQAQVLNLLQQLKAARQLTYVLISHDLNVIEYASDRVIVLYLGKIVETGPATVIAESPKHPYTQALFKSAPSMDPSQRLVAPPLTGDPPNPLSPPSGCRFRTRCPFATAQCADVEPPLREISSRHFAACHLYSNAS